MFGMHNIISVNFVRNNQFLVTWREISYLTGQEEHVTVYFLHIVTLRSYSGD
jgi:hypothetical protein